MKKSLVALMLAAAVASASAATFFNAYGVLMGNVCRDGLYFSVMPVFRPVGSSCPMVDSFGVTRGWGYVSNE